MYPIDFFFRSARAAPDAPAIETPREVVTYSELAHRVRALAAAMQDADPRPQSRVGICARNNVGHVTALLATLAAGKVWVPLNPRAVRHELDRIVAFTEPSLLVADETVRDRFDARGAPVWTCHGADGVNCLRELEERFAGKSPALFNLSRDATQAIKFTGGSTGAPKGVMQPYRAWTACAVNQVVGYGFNRRDRCLLAAPVTHGTSTYVVPILAAGGCHVLMDETTPGTVLDAFRHRGVTTVFMPPTLVYMLMAEAGGPERFPALRHLIYGGAPMPVEKIRAAQAAFGNVLETTYGQTEAPQICTLMRADELAREENMASVGRPGLLSDVAIMSPDGRLVPDGEIGEIVVRGDLVMTGYWKMPEKTAEVLVDGWLHTGDRGLVDERGYLFIKDRLRDVIITGGFNVYPIDVENVIGQHPAVHECVVFGVPDEKWGEAVQVAVQLRKDASVTAQALLAFAKERLGPVKTPKAVHFHDDLPRTPVGKIAKDIVKSAALARQEKAQA